MCKFSGRLVAWLDRELPEAEAIDVEWHVRQCAECRRTVSSYQEISDAFLECYTAMPGPRTRRPWRWAAMACASAAAILLIAVAARPHPQPLPALPQAPHAPAVAFEKTSPRMVAVRARHTLTPAPNPKPSRERWIAVEPTVEVALPAEALFPPGAVPAGFTFIADIQP